MSDVLAVFIWWLLLQAMGLVALPLVFRLLRWLPDRGYSVAKPAGLLLGNYVLWLLGNLGWLRNTTGGILIAFGLVAAFGLWVYRRWDDGPKLIDWLRAHRRWLVAYETVFLVALIGWAIFRAHNPDLTTTEKPMEFAFMNAIDRSPSFPPSDPWLSGFSISYYYFGYVMMSTLMKLSALNSGVVFSLTNAMWFALTAAGAFGIAANLVAASKRATLKAMVTVGVLGAIFVSLMGNLEGSLEVAHANGVGSPEFWRWLDIQEINTPAQTVPSWPPARPGWWWWRASRVVHDYPLASDRTNPAEYQELIDEFPFFSFFLGDNHPHVLALPYALMSLALAFNLYRMGATEDVADRGWRGWFWDAAPIAVTYPVFLGALSFLNTWDFPIHVFIAALAWGLGRWMRRRPTLPAKPEGADGVDAEAATEVPAAQGVWTDSALALIACGIAGAVAYLPFYLAFRSQAAGLVPNIYNPTRLPQFFVMFGPFLLVGAFFVVTQLLRAMRRRQLTLVRAVLGPLAGGVGIVIASGVLTAAATLAVLAVSPGARAKVDEWSGVIAGRGLSLAQVIVARLGDIGVPVLLGVSLAAIGLVLRARRDETEAQGGDLDRETPAPFALLLFGVGGLLTFAVEYVYLLDFFGYRMNTVFKFYYQAWALWGVASAYAVYHLWQSRERLTGGASRTAFAAAVALVVVSGMVYPVLALLSGTTGGGVVTLDARAPTMQVAPDEVAAVDWLKQNASGAPVILEAVGGSYRADTSRLSAWTGLRSVLGWDYHEGQWRGTYDDINPRRADIDRIYSTGDAQTALELLGKYGVQYVYVGPNELAKYAPAGLSKFGSIAEIVFQQGESTLYRVQLPDDTVANR